MTNCLAYEGGQGKISSFDQKSRDIRVCDNVNLFQIREPCESCNFSYPFYKLYQEVQTPGRCLFTHVVVQQFRPG